MDEIKLFFESFQPAQWVVVFSTLIGAIVSIWTSIKSRKDQKKWNQIKLDADLKAKARIEWIQKVREHTADLLSICYGILNETDNAKLFEKVQEAKKHSDILILFFGDVHSSVAFDKNVLENTQSNENKNNMMVLFISTLFERINQYYKDCVDNKLGKLQESYKQARDLMYEFPLREEFLGCYTTEDGDEIPQFEPILDPELENETRRAEIQIQNYRQSVLEIHKLINELRNYMRIYLKIEWDIAKQGK